MTRMPQEELIEMLNSTFAKEGEGIEAIVRKNVRATNAPAIAFSFAERSSIASYEYFLSRLDTGRSQ